MGLGDLFKVSAKRVVGIDCSTNSLGFAIFEGDQPIQCGEVFFDGRDIFEKLADAQDKVAALVDAGILVGDYVGMESAVMVRNSQVVIKLAYVYGAVLGALMKNGTRVETIPPITWQSSIGNKNLTKAEKEKIKADFPGKSVSWYQNKGREMRKQRTLEFARQYFKIDSNSDNVGDAVGIAWYTAHVLTK